MTPHRTLAVVLPLCAILAALPLGACATRGPATLRMAVVGRGDDTERGADLVAELEERLVAELVEVPRVDPIGGAGAQGQRDPFVTTLAEAADDAAACALAAQRALTHLLIADVSESADGLRAELRALVVDTGAVVWRGSWDNHQGGLGAAVAPWVRALLTATGHAPRLPPVTADRARRALADLSWRGYAALRDDDTALARATFAEITALAPARIRALQGMALVALQEERYDAAISLAERALSARPAVIRALAARTEVASLRLDRSWRAIPRSATPATAAATNLEAIAARPLWEAGITGAGVVVASLDTGADALHPDLADRWRGGDNSWFDPFGEHPAPADVDGHGTQSLGLAVGGASRGAPLGVAPGARWIAAKIYDDRGRTTLSAIHEALQWLLDPDGDPATDDAPDVVNNSWGFEDHPGECEGEFQADLDALRAAGIAVVFSAGNAGPGGDTSVSPANGAGVIAVGALGAGSSLLAASSRGPAACDGRVFPALVAPGWDVLTADVTYGGAYLPSYAYVSGTSFAAPHVTGAIALLLEAHPGADVAAVEDALLGAAVDLGPAGPDDGFGYGALDVAAADALLAGAQGPDPGGPVGDADAGRGAAEGCGGARSAAVGSDWWLLAAALLAATRRRRRPAPQSS
ncbi:MAG: hypothetical protein CVU56_21470 [Deltaproteobacteria bacterium HGW-Deltaproteobacteria-14]|nr:MAG: hypothetical protein CVU56_21470 [Deltaproteobacteria bacterium HGW-Deltaproteobacteria-14]